MILNVVKQDFGLLALALALSLAALPALADSHVAEIALGMSGATLKLTQAEDGSYAYGGSTMIQWVRESVDGVPLEVLAENGSVYQISRDSEGAWMATFRAPAPVSVDLGASGTSVMIAMREDGSSWIGDMAVMDGSEVMSASGNWYVLAVGDGGMWMASYVPSISEVTLGASGDMVEVVKAEDGSYWIGDMALVAGATVTSSDGSEYRLTMGMDGMWMATLALSTTETVMLGTSGGSATLLRAADGGYSVVSLSGVSGYMVDPDGNPVVAALNGNSYTLIADEDGVLRAHFIAPDPVAVALGISGESVEIEMAEDGSYRIGDMGVQPGDTVRSSAGVSYTLSLKDGMWTAAFEGPSREVRLGTHGGSVTIVAAEDGGYRIGDTLLSSGGSVIGNLGNEYRLTLDEAGAWSATFVVPDPVAVALGTSGTAMLQRAENGSWSHMGRKVAPGSLVAAPNGDLYRLSLSGGVWSAMHQAMTTAIEGTDLTATVLEGGTGFEVSGTMLPPSGLGTVTVGDASYQVWLSDGKLIGAQFQTAAWDETTAYFVGDVTIDNFGFVGDDSSTPQNEERTGIVVDGDVYSYGDLVSSGVATALGNNFVTEARQDLEEIRGKIGALFIAFPDGGETFDEALEDLWDDGRSGAGDVAGVLEAAFGRDALRSDSQPEEPEDLIPAIDGLIDSLSSATALAAADSEEDGLLEGALDEMSAQAAFDAYGSVAVLAFGRTGAHSYGAVSRLGRENALSDLAYDAVDLADDETQIGLLGAFAYSTDNDTTRSYFVQTSGSAFYRGGTVAVDHVGGTYHGDMTVQVSFGTSVVYGLVSNLGGRDGERWAYGGGDAQRIHLPPMQLRTNGTWRDVAASRSASVGTATIEFVEFAGSPDPVTVNGTFSGELVGGNGPSAGSGVVGAWSIHDRTGAVLYGSYGADRFESTMRAGP